MIDIEYIARRVGFDHARDIEAAGFFRELVMNSRIAADANQVLENLANRMENKLVFVTGASIGLKKNYKKIKNFLENNSAVVEFIAADGTCRYLLENDRIPVAITTDLDGGIDSIMAAGREGSVLAVLAHGDNKELIEDFFSKVTLPENDDVAVIPVVQVANPEPPLYNLGGFTDGDRGVLLSEISAARIILVGFDFHGRIGSYSKPSVPSGGISADKRKKVKLAIAREIIDSIAEQQPGKIWTVNPGSVTDHVKLATTEILIQFVKELAIKK